MLEFLVALCVACSCPAHKCSDPIKSSHPIKGYGPVILTMPIDTVGDPGHFPPPAALIRFGR